MMTVKDFKEALARYPDNMLVVFENAGEWITFTGLEPNDTVLIQGPDAKKVDGIVLELY